MCCDHSNSPLMDGFMKHDTRTDGDINHNDSKSRMAFLDIHRDNNHLRNSGSPDKSPTSGVAKSFVPPLDFTTLHENVGSQGTVQIFFFQKLWSTHNNLCIHSFVIDRYFINLPKKNEHPFPSYILTIHT